MIGTEEENLGWSWEASQKWGTFQRGQGAGTGRARRGHQVKGTARVKALRWDQGEHV